MVQGLTQGSRDIIKKDLLHDGDMVLQAPHLAGLFSETFLLTDSGLLNPTIWEWAQGSVIPTPQLVT